MANSIPNAHNAFCCYHIAANVQTKHGTVIKRYVLSESRCWEMMEIHDWHWSVCFCYIRLFWKCVYADNKADFDKFIDQIRKIKPLAADYIIKIPHNQWATYACDVHRFGHVTSNLAEIANSFLTRCGNYLFFRSWTLCFATKWKSFINGRSPQLVGLHRWCRWRWRDLVGSRMLLRCTPSSRRNKLVERS